MAKLTLIRGLPGSGKTTLAAKQCMGDNEQVYHIEADMFHVNDQEEYVFDASRIRKSHEYCKQITKLALEAGRSVYVANTFTQMWEMKWYIGLARKMGIQLNVVECTGDYGNIHNIPEEVIEKMRNRWEKYDA